MKGTRPALRYAKAVLNLAKSSNADAEVNENMKLIVATIEGSSDLRTMLKSPIIPAADKYNVLTALFGDKVNTIVKGLFTLLQDNKRMVMLEPIARQYGFIFDHHNNLQVAKVTTAVTLTKELEEKIHAKIVELTGNSASIENIVNPNILGGFILRVGDVQYDASISNQFNELRKVFDNSHYIPKI